MNSPSLNGPCPCGSGKKFKRCCGAKPAPQPVDHRAQLRQWVDGAYRAQQYQDYPTAARLYDEALKLAPGDSGLLGMRGMVEFARGEHEAAEQWVARAIQLNPDDSRLHNFLGQIYAAQEGLAKQTEAERAFARAVSLAPDFFEAWCNLGICLQKSQQLQEAIAAYDRALALQPTDAQLHLALAEVNYLLGELDRVETLVRKFLALGGAETVGRLWLALVLRAQGKEAESEAEESTAMRKGPAGQVYELLVKFGRTDVLVGNLDQAEHWLGQAMRLWPDRAASYVELSDAKKFRESDRPYVDKLETLEVRDDAQRRVEFALGKVYGDLGDYERSFQHYAKANALVSAKLDFDPAALARDTDWRIATFSREFFAGAPRGSDSDVPILIVGTPRSGTTLTEQIVSSHSQIGGAGELSYWGRLGGRILRDMARNYTRDNASILAEGYLNVLRGASSDAKHITDKMPGNFNMVGLIHAVFPNAKIIHCRRNPVDACLSMFFQNFNDGHAYKFSLDGLAVFYREYLRLMAHWREVLPPGTMHEIQYEDLVEDTEGESQKLMRFLGLEWEAEQMDFFKKERPVFTCSKWQVRQPIYKTSRDRWRRYEQHLGPLLGLLDAQ